MQPDKNNQSSEPSKESSSSYYDEEEGSESNSDDEEHKDEIMDEVPDIDITDRNVGGDDSQRDIMLAPNPKKLL